MIKRLMSAVIVAGALLSLLFASTAARGDWATAQSSRGVRSEPNDFWYWHKIGPSAEAKNASLLPTDIIYDEDHTYFWAYGDNYLNLPRAWGIVKAGDSTNPVVIASTDTEFMISHYDLSSNIYANPAEAGGSTSIDDDGNGIIDDIGPIATSGSNVMGTVYSYSSWSNAVMADPNDEEIQQHGTNMLSLACAVTDNEGWWVGRDYEDYIQELPSHAAGIPGISWNAKLMGSAPHGANNAMLDVVEQKLREGVNIRVMSCSWVGQTPDSDWVDRLEANGVLCVLGGGNNNWTVKNSSEYGISLVVGGVEYETYRRARINGWSDSPYEPGVDYKPSDTYGRRLDVMGYIPFGGGWYSWAWPDASLGHYESVSGNSMIWSLGWANITGASSYSNMTVGGAASALLGIPGVPPAKYDPAGEFVIAPCIMPTDCRTSGATPQVAGVAALLFTLYPDLFPAQAVGMIRRGSVSVDALNTNTCCSLASSALCNANNTRVEDTNCNGLLGAGRVDAYRTLTLWGTVPADTTLSGRVYVSGDVLVPSGVTVTVAAGTHFYVAPDDITQLAPWEPEDQYDMNGATANGMYGSQASPAGAIEFIIANGATLLINGTASSPVVFDSYVNDAQTASDWIGITNNGTVSKPNGAGSLILRHSTNGAP